MTDSTALADALIDAHLNGGSIAPSAPSLSRAEIMAVQARVSAALGPVAGFKVGTSPDGPPILAPIQTRYVVANGGTRAVPEKLGIELEVGFELVEPLPSPGLPARPERHFRPCAVLELVETRLSGAAAERMLPTVKIAMREMRAVLVRRRVRASVMTGAPTMTPTA